jgi:integrase
LSQLNRATVARELGRIEQERGPIAMTRARAALSAFLSWCLTQGHEITNVVAGTVKHESEARDRVLKPKELAVIYKACGDDDYGRIIKLAMLTAARRSQIGSLKRSELRLATSDVATEDRLIALPPQGGKKARKGGSKHNDPFLIPLSKQALTILEQQPVRQDSAFVFGNDGEGGFSGWSRAKASLDKRIGDAITEPWGIHDLRRSFATLGQDVLKIDDRHLDAVLNHKPAAKAGVLARYNYATLLDEKRTALERWGAYIESLVHPKPRLATVQA